MNTNDKLTLAIGLTFLAFIASIITGCGSQNLNSVTTNPACQGSAVGTWDSITSTNVLTLTAACSGSTTYCNERFTYAPINGTTFTLTVSQTNGGPECLPIGPTICTASMLDANTLAVNCGGGKNLTTNHTRM